MKSIFNKAFIGVLALLPVFASCEKEPEVGTPLYPVEEEYHGPLVYFYEGTQNPSMSSVIVRTPIGLTIPEDTIKIYAQLTKPVNQDVKVSVEEIVVSEAVAGSLEILTESLKFEVGEVVIKAGERRSEEPLKIVLQESDGIANVEDFAITGVKINTNASGVKVSAQYSTYLWKIQMKEMNVKVGTEAGKTVIDPSQYTMSAGYYSTYVTDLIDNDFTTSWYCYLYYSDRTWVGIELPEKETITAVYIYPWCYEDWWSGDLTWEDSVNCVEIFVSQDGVNWKSHGEVAFTPAEDLYTPSVVEFYSPVNTKYIRIYVRGSVGGYSYPEMPEIRITK